MATLHGASLSAPCFPTAFAHLLSLGHILVILPIFQTFSLLLHLLWWPVISDLWWHYCNCFGAPPTVLIWRQWTSSIDVCVLTAPPTGRSPVSLPLLGPCYSLKHNNIAIRPINNPYSGLYVFKWKEDEAHLTLNQKLEMIRFSGKGMLKADGLKARLLRQTAELWTQKESSWGN